MTSNIFSPKKLFIWGMTIGLFAYIMLLILTEGAWFDSTLFNVAHAPEFSDFFGYIGFHQMYDNAYEDVFNVYPPLQVLMYKVIEIMSRAANTIGSELLADTAIGSMIFSGWIVFCMVGIGLCFDISNEIKGIEKYCLLISFCFSYPFFSYAIKTGNPVILVLICLTIAMYFMDSDDKIKREITLIAIAMAAASKIIPAIFGIFYLKEKRYKEAIRLTIYGIVFFFVPFVYYDGVNGAILFAHNVIKDADAFIFPWTALDVFRYVFWYIGDVDLVMTVSKIASYIFGIILLVLCFIEEEKWISISYLCEFMLLVSPVTQAYSLVYMGIPMLFWIDKKSVCSQKEYVDYIYAMLFVMIFWGWKWSIEYGALWGMLIIQMISTSSKLLGKRIIKQNSKMR